jgi:hypothetical protein
MSLVTLSTNVEQSFATLPYDILNVIFEYLSHITDSGWILDVNNKGKIRLLPRAAFTGIHYINHFKLGSLGNQVQLKIQQWASIEENTQEKIVQAIEQPYLANDQQKIEEDRARGVVSMNRAYTYHDPETGIRNVVYVDLQQRLADSQIVFRQGCVYDDNGDTFVVTGYGSGEEPGTVRIVVNPFNMIWDIEGDHWADDDVADALLELGEDIHAANALAEFDDADFDFLPLQMYM